MKDKGCKIIAHRGASGLVEFGNSMESFREALRVGADMIEFDVRKTQDDVMVAFHDPEIEGKKISDLDYEELVEITEKKGFKAPTVEDVIMLSKGKIGLDIELKEEGYEERLIKMVRSYMEYDSYVMKSFSDKTIRSIKDFDEDITTGLLLGLEDPDSKIRTRLSELFPRWRLKRCGADFAAPNFQLLRFFYLWRMRRAGLDVFVWTVNDTESMEHWMREGVDALITDRPDLALKVKRALE